MEFIINGLVWLLQNAVAGVGALIVGALLIMVLSSILHYRETGGPFVYKDIAYWRMVWEWLWKDVGLGAFAQSALRVFYWICVIRGVIEVIKFVL